MARSLTSRIFRENKAARQLALGWRFLRHPQRSSYVKLAAALFMAGLAAVDVLGPEITRYTAVITGKAGVFQIGTNPGQDLSAYYAGAKGYFGYGINPYDNKPMWDLFNYKNGTHPITANPTLNTSLSITLRDRPSSGLGQHGFVATPLNLLFFEAILVGWMSFDHAMIAWALFSALAVTGMTALFAWTLSKSSTVAGKLGDTLIAVTLFALIYRPVQDSIILGNIDGPLYLLFTGLAIYLLAFKRQSGVAWKAAALLLAFATSEKLTPVVIAGYFIIGLAQKLFRRFKDPRVTESIKPLLKRMFEFRVLGAYTVGFLAITTLTLTVLRWDVAASWFPKMQEFGRITVDPVTRPTLSGYLHYWLPELFGEGADSLADMAVWAARLSAVALMIRIIRRRAGEWIPSREELRSRHFLLFSATALTLLPTLLPHWWFTYNSAMIIPFLILYWQLRDIPSQSLRRWGTFALVLAYGFINAYGFYVADYSHLSPLLGQFRLWLIANTTSLNSDGGLVRMADRVNLFSSYPGTLLMAAVSGLIWRFGNIFARSSPAPQSPSGQFPKGRKKKKTRMDPRSTLSRRAS